MSTRNPDEETETLMNNMIDEIPESRRNCPICKADGKIIRVLPFGFKQSEKQYKLACSKCEHTWLHHSDE
jgi:hypothetical protein